jgi:hypothetical protein
VDYHVFSAYRQYTGAGSGGSTEQTKALSNARSLTALRTAARTPFISEIQHSLYPTLGSVLATVLLHLPETASFRQLVVFGAGPQINAHIRQLLATYPSSRTLPSSTASSTPVSKLSSTTYLAHTPPRPVRASRALIAR